MPTKALVNSMWEKNQNKNWPITKSRKAERRKNQISLPDSAVFYQQRATNHQKKQCNWNYTKSNANKKPKASNSKESWLIWANQFNNKATTISLLLLIIRAVDYNQKKKKLILKKKRIRENQFNNNAITTKSLLLLIFHLVDYNLLTTIKKLLGKISLIPKQQQQYLCYYWSFATSTTTNLLQ